VAACAERGVVVTNTPGVLTAATADMAMTLLLAAARRLGEGERWLRSGRPWSWAPNFLLGVDLSGSTLGILGMGEIGQAIARRAQGFDMTICYHNRRRRHNQFDAQWLPLEQLLATAEFLVVSCPLTDQTRGLIDASRLACMPHGAVLVSITAAVVDEVALADALERRTLFAAAIDNHANEPTISRELLRQERAVLSPHLGSATVRTRQAMGNLAVDNILSVLAGKPPLSQVPGSRSTHVNSEPEGSTST
jgi:glyoxylate reductase